MNKKYRKSDNSRLCVILGQSMKPFFHSGEIVCLEKVDFDKLAIGNVICFKRTSDKASIIHRIIAITFDNGVRVLETQGDNFFKSDGLVYAENVEGVIYYRYRSGRVRPIFRIEEILGVVLSPLLRLMRCYMRKLLAVCVNILYPYMDLKRVSLVKDDGEELSMLWRGKKIASLKTSDGNRWVHPWFRNTPVAMRLNC